MPASKFPLHKPSLRKRESSGFSLIEAAIVLGIVGLVIGGIWVAASAVSDRMAATRIAGSLVQMADATQNLLKRSAYTEVNITSAAIGAGIIPSGYTYVGGVNTRCTIAGASAAISPDGTSVCIQTYYDSVFYIVITGMETGVCADVVLKVLKALRTPMDVTFYSASWSGIGYSNLDFALAIQNCKNYPSVRFTFTR